MTIEEQLNARLTEAMRARSEREVSVLRMVKSQATVARSAPGFSGKTDDAFWSDVIARYVKQQKKAIAEFEKAGDAGREQIAALEFEVDYLAPFLPAVLSEEEVRELVKTAIAKTGAVGPKMLGKVMGFVMKDHKGKVDAAMVKRLAAEELG